MTRVDANEIFDPAFLAKLEALRVIARRVPAGGRHGEHRSRARGAGVEFTDVRPYAPGDDFRYLDWNLFRRLDRLFLRLFLEDEDLPVYFLLDQSASMQLVAGAGGATKTRAARQAVAALAYLCLNRMDRVSLFPFSGEALRPMPGLAGRNAFHRLLGYLASLPASGGTGLVDAVGGFAHRRLRRGLCVVASDFFDPRGPGQVLAALGRVPHRMLLLRPVHPGEDRPALAGELEVVDCETGESLALSADDRLLARYQEAYRAYEADLAGLSRTRHSRFLALRTDRPVVEQIATLFPQGVLTA